MCGILGLTTSEPQQIASILDFVKKGLKCLNKAGCGSSSWGYMFREFNPKQKKRATLFGYVGLGNAHGLNMEVWKKVRVTQAVIGHVRLPSIGKVCLENAHPWIGCDDEFTFAANGTTPSAIRAELEKEHKIQGTTDSERLMHLIEEKCNGNYSTATVMAAFSKVTKRYSSNNFMMLIRRDGRIIISKNWNSLYYTTGEQNGIKFSIVCSRELPLKGIEWTEVKSGEMIMLQSGNLVVHKFELPPTRRSYGGYSSDYQHYYGTPIQDTLRHQASRIGIPTTKTFKMGIHEKRLQARGWLPINILPSGTEMAACHSCYSVHVLFKPKGKKRHRKAVFICMKCGEKWQQKLPKSWEEHQYNEHTRGDSA